MKRITRFFAIPLLLLAACDTTGTTEPETTRFGPETVRSSAHGNSAEVWTETYTYPFGPAPLSVPCLEDEVADDFTIGGTWLVRAKNLLKPGKRYHLNEYLDYSDTRVTAGDLTWEPAPGAHEKIVWHQTLIGTRNYVHEFHARYNSQDGLPDLRVSHWVHLTRDALGNVRRFERQLFSAECLGR